MASIIFLSACSSGHEPWLSTLNYNAMENCAWVQFLKSKTCKCAPNQKFKLTGYK